jgi:hypothetical protein
MLSLHRRVDPHVEHLEQVDLTADAIPADVLRSKVEMM